MSTTISSFYAWSPISSTVVTFFNYLYFSYSTYHFLYDVTVVFARKRVYESIILHFLYLHLSVFYILGDGNFFVNEWNCRVEIEPKSQDLVCFFSLLFVKPVNSFRPRTRSSDVCVCTRTNVHALFSNLYWYEDKQWPWALLLVLFKQTCLKLHTINCTLKAKDALKKILNNEK